MPRPPASPQSPVVVPAQPEGPQPEEEPRPALGLAHPAGGGRDRALPKGVPPNGRRAPRPLGARQRPAQRPSGAVTSFLPSSSQTGTGAAPALLLPWPQSKPSATPARPPRGQTHRLPPAVLEASWLGSCGAGCRAQQSELRTLRPCFRAWGRVTSALIPKTEVTGFLQVSPCTRLPHHASRTRKGGRHWVHRTLGRPRPWAGVRALARTCLSSSAAHP